MTLPIDITVTPDDASPEETTESAEQADVSPPDVTVPEAAAPDAPDRADAPVSEITERFLKVVLAHVPLARIEELHLFSPLRQGGVETGIAVIAARVPVVVVEQPVAPELPLDDEVDALLDVAVISEHAADDELDDVELLVAEPAIEPELEPEIEPQIEAEIEAAPAPRVRHTVYTARYRLVQKGPERGKWEADVVAEAEAPLITVDLVVRGVQRRAGEESEIVRYTAPQLARALRVPYPTL